MELVEAGEADRTVGAVVPAPLGVVFAAIVGVHLGGAIILMALFAGAADLLGHLFGPPLVTLARTAGLG